MRRGSSRTQPKGEALAVFIFPIRAWPDAERPGVLHTTPAGLVEAALRTLNVKSKNVDPLYRESTRGKLTRAGIDQPERVDGPAQVFVDPALGFAPSDIADGADFGNGTSMGTLLLRDGRVVICGRVVVDDADVAAMQARLADVKGAFLL